MRIRSAAGSVLLTLACAAGVSCVSQEDYRDALDQVRYHQRRENELNEQNTRLQREVERLRDEVARGDVRALEAGYGEEFSSRIEELRNRIRDLGRPLEGIERFDVEGGYVLMVQDKILFDLGSAEISPAGRDALADVADQIAAQPHGKIWVRGHTDTTPISKPETVRKYPHGNLQLSAERAVQVAAYLIGTRKVSSDQVAVVGFGPHLPVAPNDTAENMRQNRRVEIFVADVEQQDG